jgi:hypothetical protein
MSHVIYPFDIKEVDDMWDYPILTDSFYKILEENPNFPWDWNAISFNPSLSFLFVRKHLDYPWEWNWLSSHDRLDSNLVIERPDLPWDWSGEMSEGGTLDFRIVALFPTKPWNWCELSFRSNLTEAFILANPGLPWDWEEIAQRTDLTPEFRNLFRI